MQVNFKVRGVEAVQAFMRSVPYGAVKVALKAFSEYVLGDERHGLRHPDPYKYASRARAYGSTGATFENGAPVPDGYFSAKQFRYVAAITHGFTDRGPHRTGESTRAWQAVPRNNGYQYTLKNDTTGGYFTRHETRQARQLKNVGWRKVSAVLAANYLGGIKAAIAAVKKFLKTK
jgi:hypothetical protein